MRVAPVELVHKAPYVVGRGEPNFSWENKFLVQPIVAGRGKRVFNDATAKMQLVTTQELDQGVLFLHYRR